ncbi:MAG: RNA polymerase sporulation sigma factor SigK [Bacilli bacterium]|nr:RNA polymerase sporulation sigma factor SigK [Bacilli bacterium]
MFLLNILKSLLIFAGTYSNTSFKEPLSKEDEEKYILLMRQGNSEARDILIEHNLRLVAHIAKKIATNDSELDDLISIGTIGLIKGIDTYEYNKKVKITTYAARCIQNEILMFYRQNKKNLNVISLNDAIGFDKDGNEITLIEIIKDDKTSIEEEVANKNYVKLIKKYFNNLNNKEKNILIKRYGLNNKVPKTQKEIANELNISRSYVSRIEKRALTKLLRLFIKNKHL